MNCSILQSKHKNMVHLGCIQNLDGCHMYALWILDWKLSGVWGRGTLKKVISVISYQRAAVLYNSSTAMWSEQSVHSQSQEIAQAVTRRIYSPVHLAQNRMCTHSQFVSLDRTTFKYTLQLYVNCNILYNLSITIWTTCFFIATEAYKNGWDDDQV